MALERLLWIDLEMSGLDVQKERIIEAAAIATDMEFNELDTYHAIVKQDQSFIDNMDEWNVEHHGKSGLLAEIPNGKDPAVVEKELCAFVDKNFTEAPVLAGNSIAHDRLFIRTYFKELASKLHYRLLDVTSWKILMHGKYGYDYPKKEAHRALDDIRESIAELKFYQEKILKP